MIKYIPVILLLIAGCTGKEVLNNKGRQAASSESDGSLAKKEAMDHFISGTVLESKNEFASAILEFQEALMFDESPGIYYSLARNYYALGKYSLALTNGKKAVELESGKKEYYSLLGDIYSVTHQPDSAARMYEKIISIDSSDISALYRLAAANEKSRPSQSIILYNKIIDESGPEWSVLARLAELNEKLGNLDDAAENVGSMLDMDPSSISLRKYLAELYIRGKKYDPAVDVLNEIIEINPDDYEARERKAQLYLEQNEWLKAGTEYKYLLSLPQVTLETKIRIGAAYFVKSLKDSSLTPTVKEIFYNIDRDTTDWQVKLFLGGIAINEGKDSSAEAYFKEVISLAQYNSEGWIRLGGLYFDNQKYSEAIRLLNEAIDIYPRDFVINLILGLSYAQIDNHAEAVKYLKTAVDINNNEVTALSAYAYSLSQLKESDEAIRYLKKALTISPGDVNLLGTLGLIYNSLEMWSACDSTYETALGIDSSNALVNNNYAYSLAERDIQLERALKMAEVAITAEPLNSSYLDTIGWVYFKLLRYDEAEKYIRKALEVAGDRPVLLEHLGDVIFMKGQKSAAMELWEKAYSLDSSNSKLKLKIDKGEI